MSIVIVCSAESHADRVSVLGKFARDLKGSAYRWSPSTVGVRTRATRHRLVDGETVTRGAQVTGEGLIGDAVSHDDTEGKRIQRKLRCRLCGLDVSARAERLDDVLDRVQHAGVDRIELATLVAILS